jgi:hypothetical protein
MASCAALKSTVIHSTPGRLREPSSIARPTASGSACSAMTSGEYTGTTRQHDATLYTLPHWQPLRPSESDCPPECQCAIAQVCESRQLELETVDSEDPHRKHRDTSMVAEWPGSPRQFLSPFPGTNTDVYSRAFFKFSQAAIGSGSRSSGVRSPTRSPLCWPCPTWPCRATRPGVSRSLGAMRQSLCQCIQALLVHTRH